MDRLGKAALEDLGLKAALEEVLNLEGKDVIETHALLVEDADADEPGIAASQRASGA